MISVEGKIFLFAICLGFVFATCYGFIMILRRSINLKDKLINEIFGIIEDFLFAFVVYCMLYNYILRFNYGICRMYIFLGVILGVILYFKIFYKYSSIIFDKVIKIINKITKELLNNVISKVNYVYKKINLRIKKIKNKKEWISKRHKVRTGEYNKVECNKEKIS